MAAAKAKANQGKKRRPKSDGVNRDSFDIRDLIYRPALVDLKPELFPDWRALEILDQGDEGACTGFGLAATINYLNHARKDPTRVSARMLYQMAKRFDQWPGTNYEGSSARGAMKGWFNNGVCSEKEWPNLTKKGTPDYLTRERQLAALKYPLGAYYRILPKRSDVHAALNEVGVVFAAADTHKGWDVVEGKPAIPYKKDWPQDGGHAFAIVGYTQTGFLIQNSWGPSWGGFKTSSGKTIGGVAEWAYEDFDANVWDLWVARPALPVESLDALRTSYTVRGGGTRKSEAGPPHQDIQDDYVHIDDGWFDEKNNYPSTRDQVAESIRRKLGFAPGTKRPKAIVIYAHGGLNQVEGCATRAWKWKPVLEANGVSQLHFIWETGLIAELRDIILGKDNAVKERAGSAFSSWTDAVIEQAVKVPGYAVWKEMREDAADAFATPANAGYETLRLLLEGWNAIPAAQRPALHFAGHSAGSILGGHLVDAWAALGGPAFASYALMAPACTVDFFDHHIAPAVASKLIPKLHRFQLHDEAEKDDTVALLYRKSLLYLVSNVLQDKTAVTPLLGMAKFDAKVNQVIAAHGIGPRVITKTPEQHPQETKSDSHGGFDNDLATMNSMLKLWLNGAVASRPFTKSDLSGF